MKRNEIVSHHEMCGREGMSLQRGMNFRHPPQYSILLSSHRAGAPYEDRLEEEGAVLIYEGHDEARSEACPNPKTVDQTAHTRTGKSTQNGLFNEAAQLYVRGDAGPLLVRVYEKIKNGIWADNGLFRLENSWTETSGTRRVFRFKLRACGDDEELANIQAERTITEHARLIPSSVKLAVWKRDRGMCTVCGAKQNLHFDHILPYAKGGTSEDERNIQLLCMKHNLEKRDRIE